MVVWGAESLIWIAIIESILLAAVVSFRPTDRGIGSWAWWWNQASHSAKIGGCNETV